MLLYWLCVNHQASRFSYLLCAAALSKLNEQFDGGRALGHGRVVIAILLRVILRCTADGLLAWRRRRAGCSLPLEQGLVFTGLAAAHMYKKPQTGVTAELFKSHQSTAACKHTHPSTDFPVSSGLRTVNGLGSTPTLLGINSLNRNKSGKPSALVAMAITEEKQSSHINSFNRLK